VRIAMAKPFECEITISFGVEHKLLQKHKIELWEIEEVVYDDPYSFSLTYRDCYFIYGCTFAGRYLLVLVRVLSAEEIAELPFVHGTNVIRVITAREMNKTQRHLYLKRSGRK
jgi:uncharacterized DUF497 family protein